MLSCFLTGIQFEQQYVGDEKKRIKIFWVIIYLGIAPILYFLDFSVDIFKNK